MKKLLVALILIASMAHAITLPKVWVASETIKAADLNANFNALNRAIGEHQNLTNLDYINAGHAGFAPQGGIDTVPFRADTIWASGTRVAPVIFSTALPATTTAFLGDLHYVHAASGADYTDTLYLVTASGTATSVPVLTTSSTRTISSGEVVGSETWYAYDSSAATSWRYTGATPLYIGYDFNASFTCNSISILGGFDDGLPSTFAVQGSHNASTWTHIATFTGQWPYTTYSQEFFFANAIAYRAYRLYVTALCARDVDHTSRFIDLADLDFVSRNLVFTPIGKCTQASRTLTLPYNYGVTSWTIKFQDGVISSYTTP
jgi:hypothetical protein